MEEKRQRPDTETGRSIPVEIVTEILDRLPLKSLARFECACKLWSSLIRSIIHRRLTDEIRASMIGYKETRQRIADQCADLVDQPDLFNSIEGLRACIDRLKGMLDEISSFVVFGDDIDRYIDRIEGLRVIVQTLRLHVGFLVDEIGNDIEVLDICAVKMQQEAAAA